MTIVSSAVALIVSNTRNASRLELGFEALSIAEGGAENAILRLLREPSYTGETLTIGSGTAVITVTGTTTKTIVSTGTAGNYQRKIQITAGYTNNILTINSWKEIQ